MVSYLTDHPDSDEENNNSANEIQKTDSDFDSVSSSLENEMDYDPMLDF